MTFMEVSVATKLEIAAPKIFAEFDRSQGVFSVRELESILRTSKLEWDLPERTTVSSWLDFMQTKGTLRKLTLQAKGYTPLTRYVWGDVSPYRLAAALWKGAYLSHGSAVLLHGLTDEIPKVIYVNREQGPKPVPSGGLTQERLDMAFSRPQRTSAYVLPVGDYRIVMLSGKNTGRLEVGEMPDPVDGSHALPVTRLERTLIDIVVRPAYAGGVTHLLDAFRGASQRVRIPELVATLRGLGYVYPYHQSLGFLLERAGVEPSHLDPLREMGLEFDFHLAHGMSERDYDATWRLFYPKGL